MLCSTLQQPSNWTMPDAMSPSKSTAAFPRPAHFVPGTHRAALRLFAKVANLQRIQNYRVWQEHIRTRLGRPPRVASEFSWRKAKSEWRTDEVRYDVGVDDVTAFILAGGHSSR